MKIKHQELTIPEENPFENCKLDRRRYAMVLTDIVNTYADGFVLAINNEWGTGKTTFVKMWEQHLINKKFKTIYFNAWENDFDSNPLVAIMSELKTLTNKDNDAIFKSVVQKGAVLVRNVTPALLKAVAKKYIDIESITDAIENTAKGATEILEEEIKEYAKKKETILDFRKELEEFVKKTETEKPLIFIIDELDRCRPNYAVEVLEQMKHFFSVPGIVFVLSIDKNHLASAVRGFYGSEQINTDEYLRRFIDLEYSIPQPSNKTFCSYLFGYYSFDKFFVSTERRNNGKFQNDVESLLKMAEFLFDKSYVTLRQQEKIFGHTRLTLGLFPPNENVFPPLLFFLIYIKIMKNEMYLKIENYVFSLQELSDGFANLIPSNFNNRLGVNIIFVQALLLHFYNNLQEYPDKEELFKIDNEGNTKSLVTSKLEDERTSLDECFNEITRQGYYHRGVSLKYLLDKINLMEPIVI